IREALEYLVAPGGTVELRCLGGASTLCGYFDDFDQLARTAARQSGHVDGVYITLNQLNTTVVDRVTNTLLLAKGDRAAKDTDVLRRRWLPLDFDPARPSRTSSTDVEHQTALDRATAVRRWLHGIGWPEPILADSGNGGHLLYRIDLPNDS